MYLVSTVERIRNEGGGVILMRGHRRPNNPEEDAHVLDLTKNILKLASKEGFKVC